MKKLIMILIGGILGYIFAGCGSQNEPGWPTFRHDGFRSGMSSANLPANLALKWNFRAPHAPETAWHKTGEELPRMHFDNCYHVVSGNGFTYFGSPVDDQLYALDSQTGQIEWTFFADGPIRFAPSLWKNRIYFGADDGLVYCLNARNGELIWKFRAGPADKKLLGNGRLISRWPVRTSVLVQDDTVYFGAGIFPYEGLFICALDAETGILLWKNDTVGDEAFELQFGGISPHGYLLASAEILYVPSGRAMPAAFNRKTGEFLYSLSPGSKVGGTWGLISENQLITGVERSGTPAKIAYNLETGQRQGDVFASFDGIDLVTTAAVSFVLTENGIDAIDRTKYPEMKNALDSLADAIDAEFDELEKSVAVALELKTKNQNQIDQSISQIEALKLAENRLKATTTRWQYRDSLLAAVILAGDKIVAGGKNHVVLLEAETGELLQQFEIDGTALGLAADNQSIFATTETGQIYCFGPGESTAAQTIAPTPVPFESDTFYQNAASRILKTSGVENGYCIILNAGEGQLGYEIARQTNLKVIGIEKNSEKLIRARRNLAQAGLYGSRVVLGNWDLDNLPEYCANLIVSDQFLKTGKIETDPAAVYRLLKPFGGVACLGQMPDAENSPDENYLQDWLKRAGPETPVITHENGVWGQLIRGSLAGAGGWTHQYSNPANTACSDDQLVTYPLGVLWFGEPGPEKMVERHARAAAPVAKNGRMFVQGENVIMAYDAYNGIKLWEREIPGANRVRVDVDGSNLALSDTGLFVATGDQCLLLDAATGVTLRSYVVPAAPDGRPRRWAYVACSGGTLFGSTGMPLIHEYNYLSEKIETGGIDALTAWFASRYDSPEAAQQDFQRSGAKWHFIADFPAWSGGIVTQERATEKLMFSDAIFAMDVPSGQTKWVHRGKQIAQITISIGDGQIFFTDAGVNQTQKSQAISARQAYFQNGIWHDSPDPIQSSQIDVRLVTVLDSETGAKKWERPVDLSGCGGDAVASAYQNQTLLFFGSFGLHDKWRFPAGELKWHRVTALSSVSGEMRWSRPLNYMVRPVIVGDEIIVEPRACDLLTGEIKTRTHPITRRTVSWEYYRPGHTCAVTSASSNCLFYRSYNAAFYDLAADRGITYFGAIRPGCWINMIPANGLLLFPEASAGCTCSFPLRTTVVLKSVPVDEVNDWSVFISQGPVTPVERLGINFGAPGDKKDRHGKLWFGYPRPKTEYGVKFNLNETIQEGMGYFYQAARGTDIPGTETPWLFTSGCVGLVRAEIPLLDPLWDTSPGIYTVRMGFFAPSGKRVFDIRLQNKTVLENFNMSRESNGNRQVVIKEFRGIPVESQLRLELVPRGFNPEFEEAPVINFMEIIREDTTAAAKNVVPGIQLKPNERLQYFQQAEAQFAQKNFEAALKNYHVILQSNPAPEMRQKVLSRLAVIGSPGSLPHIEKYLRISNPIFWDYQPPTNELIDQVVAVYLAIAKNLAPENPAKAEAMLTKAAELATDFSLSDRIVAALMQFGHDSVTTTPIPPKITPGIRYEYFEGFFNSANDLDEAQPKSQGTTDGFRLENPAGVTEFGYIFSGFLTVPKGGIYTFYLESNHGSKLFIRGREIIDNDGGHGAMEKTAQLALQAGVYPLVVKYFQMGGAQALKVSWESKEFDKRELTAQAVGIGE